GIIVPELHYGRDALIGIALVLSYLATSGKTLNDLRAGYADYHMVKDKVQLSPELDVEAKLAAIKETYQDEELNAVDGLKIDFAEGWVHLRRSNTEPIMRIYAESDSPEGALALVERVKRELVSGGN
ncbi:MAG: phosphoglucosamine mutase, partial [Lewinella sp.]|nr:phosphoglucosamine mutase [Lewinella sp.]